MKAKDEPKKEEVNKKCSPTDDELAKRWIDRSNETIHALGNFRRYADGIWPELTIGVVEGEVLEVLEKAKPEGVRPNTGRLKSVIGLAKVKLRKNNALMDINPNILVFPNGTLDLALGVFRDHSSLDYAIFSLPYNYDADAKPETWLRVLSRLSPEVVALLQEFFGICLTRETKHEIALWITGPSGSGKSSIIEGIKAMLGTLATQLSLSDIERSKFTFPLIVGKNVIYSTEQFTATPTSIDNVNKLVSGETMMIEAKYEAPFNYKPCLKVIWASSDLPYIPFGDGFYRRFKVINVPPLISERSDLDIKGLISREGPGIFIWALEGLRRLEKRGHFDVPLSVRSATEKFEAANDMIQDFIDECCELGMSNQIQASVIYSAYCKWCLTNGYIPKSNKKVAQDWENRGFTRRSLSGYRYWMGVTLKSD